MKTGMLSLLRGLILVATLLAALPAAAQDSPRAATHDGYGRMVFDWNGPVVHAADVAGDQLVLRFSQPVAGNPRAVLKPLNQYVRDVATSPDRKVLTFTLARPVQVKAFVVGKSVVVDLLAQPGQISQPAAAPPRPAAGVPTVAIRSGEHTGFHRIVFDWPRQVDYKVDNAVEGRAVVTFQGRGHIDAERLKAQLPADISLIGIDEQDKTTVVTLAVPTNARLRHFPSGRGVAVDVVRPADGAPPRPPEGRQEAKVPLAPPPSAVEPVPAVKPSDPAPKPPAQVVEEMRAQAPEAPAEKPASLVFAWKDATAAAVFRRAGWLWIVFDRPQQIDLGALRKAAGTTVSHIEQVPNRDATVLRLITPPDYNPALRREGLQWIVDLARQPMRPPSPIEVRRHVEQGQTALFLPVAEGGVVLPLQDPEVGDQLRIVPVAPLGAGVYPGSDLAEVEVPPTTQGIVVVPRVDGLAVNASRTGITITAPGGLSLGAAGDTPAVGMRHGEAPNTGASPLDIAGWSRGGIEHLRAEKRRLTLSLGELPRGNRNPTRFELARLLLANGHHPEALSILRVMAEDEPSITDTGAYRAVRGAAQFLMNRFDLALEDLSHPDILGAPEVTVWRAATQASLEGGGAAQAPILEKALPLIQDYPPRIKIQIAFAMAAALLDANVEKAAGDILAVIENERLTRSQKEQLAYLQGVHQQLAGNFETAAQRWQVAEDGENRLYRARAAMAHVLLDLKTGAIDQRQAITRLDKLRFAWRGDDFEFGVLKRIGEMQIATGEFGEGLRTLRQLAGNFGQHKDTQAVTQLMAETFERLFFGGAADTLPPLTAIALFDEFRELTPSGDKGDHMIRKLADRLATVDLLDRAGELLRHQVDYRLSGADKTRVATQLAVLYLLNHNPEAALQVLDASDAPDLPPNQQQQRRHLAAQALSDLGRAPEAIARLKGDNSTSARLLRAEIHWRQKNWAEAADAFAQLIVAPTPGKPLDPDSGRFVLHWATALNLANDDGGLAKLRAGYAELMAASPYGDAFTLLTSDTGAARVDYRQVADKIREAEKFQAFMAAYRQRLQAEGLSTIN